MTHNTPPHPDVSVSVKINMKTAKRSKAALKALIPDNHTFPEGLSLAMSASGPVLSLRLEGRSVRVETLVSTLDEILEHVSLCQKVMPN